ncbi:MAG: hypothetical protein ABJO57_08430 [Lentilitoribacter sp.]
MSKKSETKSAAIAAAGIMLFVASSYFFMPPLLRWLSDISVWLAYIVVALFVLAFFGIFWVRSKFQKKRDQQEQQ